MIKTCSAIADLKSQILRFHKNGVKIGAAKQYMADQMGAIPGIQRSTIDAYIHSVSEIYALPPLKTEDEVMGVRGYIFSNCVDGLLADPV